MALWVGSVMSLDSSRTFFGFLVTRTFALSTTEEDKKEENKEYFTCTGVRTHEIPSSGTMDLPVEPLGRYDPHLHLRNMRKEECTLSTIHAFLVSVVTLLYLLY